MRYRAFNIKYDTDGKHIPGLPKQLLIEVDDDPDFDPAYGLADPISDKTGWMVESFEFEVLEPCYATMELAVVT